ncbi:hypothetical protein [Chitinilyticum piscinae]|uniref:Uncharacterized protein n=1 Tax=Chitinilyticum piscinae TaxID=2866724 RepID=A0A8J7FMN6_9NEIS|nr:hypothetical protein [Chitinilyticum piscinae]MBE9610842.1 hypothetical protein [Chitinilyticum piscinae]
MHNDIELIFSPLQQKYTENDQTVEVCIYRLPDSGWTLEVVDQYNNSTIFDGEFESDQDAFDLFLSEIREQGIESFIGLAPGVVVH